MCIKNYLYGFTWLRKDLSEICHISERYAGEIINSMIDNKLINVEQNGNYTIIKLPVAQTESKSVQKENKNVVDNSGEN